MTTPWTYAAWPDRPGGSWPGGKRIALWVAVGVEAYRFGTGMTEDILPGDPGQLLTNTAWRDYGNRVGAFRLFDRLSAFGLRPAVLLNTDVYETAPPVLDAARAVGAEIIAHGKSNSDTLAKMTSEDELAYLTSVYSSIREHEGTAPLGWSSPWLAHNNTTLCNLSTAGFRCLLDLRLDDQPCWIDTGNGHLLAIPYAAELNDSTTVIGRQTSARDFAGMIVDELEELLAAPDDRPVVMSIVLHSFISGQPFRLRALTEALERISAASEDVWLTTPQEIYRAVQRNPGCATGPAPVNATTETQTPA